MRDTVIFFQPNSNQDMHDCMTYTYINLFLPLLQEECPVNIGYTIPTSVLLDRQVGIV